MICSQVDKIFPIFIRSWAIKCFGYSLGSTGYKSPPGSFLFSLVNPSSLPPTKMPLRAGAEGNAILSHSSYGPIFGSGHDLCITNAPNSNNCSVSLNNAYQCPTGQNANTFLTGSQYFTVSEMEVFGFQ